MHDRRGWPPEVDQLCGSEPFKLFCGSPLPTADQRVICQACGIPTHLDPPQHARARTCHPTEPHLDLDPETRWNNAGNPPWEAPYVWEGNY